MNEEDLLDFKSELKALLSKYNATLSVEINEDPNGLIMYDFEVSVGWYYSHILHKGCSDISASDIL